MFAARGEGPAGSGGPRKEVMGAVIEFKLDPKSGVPFYRQIIDQIRYGIASGQLRVGEQLPTVRQLAVKLSVNLNTISKAYRELESQGIVETRRGTGTFVSTEVAGLSKEETSRVIADLIDRALDEARHLQMSEDELMRLFRDRVMSFRRERERRKVRDD